MSILDKFIVFANGLSADQRESVEETLAAMMKSLSAAFDFTAAEHADLKNRVAEPKPEYADPAEIARMFGKPFRG